MIYIPQYFDNNYDVKDDIKYLTLKIKNVELTFKTNSNIFSKNKIDYGTNLLLNSISINDTTKQILDVGCGYGTIGISLAKQYPFVNIDMIDINEKAVLLSKENSNLNNVENTNIYISDFFTNISNKYDCIVSNPPIRIGKEKLLKFIEDSKRYLNTNGELWLVIRKQQGALSYIKHINNIFNNYEIIEKKKGYFIIKTIN